MSQAQKEVSIEPEILSINVHDAVNTIDGFGSPKNIFQNPKNDPRIAGVANVLDLEALKRIAPLAFDYSKETGKPVLLVVKAK